MHLSIVIPVYNVEKYIERCILSTLKQNLDKNDYEIVVVDDETPDNSMEIVNKLAKKHTNIKTVSQKNKGLGGARNTGVNHAEGTYVLFLDSDDYLNENVLKEIITTALDNNLDILDFGAQGIQEDGKVIYTVKQLLTGKAYSGAEYFSHGYHQSACVRLYKKAFLQKNKLQFREKVYVEDVEFNFKAVFLAEKIMGVNTIVSSFVQTTGSITRSHNELKNKKLVTDILDAIKKIDCFSKDIITKNSVAYKKSREKVNEQTITLLKILFTKTKDYSFFKEIICQLKNIDLYPLQFRSTNKKRELFKVFSNNEWLFSQFYKAKPHKK
ncbi:glycosyltransferase [Galbibacter sp. PAP.153]|uniref:glycosyltransferase family 2 protein n=1 Tax=Galbibacter sp. PAP.153 TaxID=3104623 RepID=UPI00300BE3FD